MSIESQELQPSGANADSPPSQDAGVNDSPGIQSALSARTNCISSAPDANDGPVAVSSTQVGSGANATAAPENRCRNCGAVLPIGHVFCAYCGQKVDVERLGLRESLREFWHSMVKIDESALALVRALSVRPGYVAREYVDGKRKRYFGPYAFLFLVVGLASAAIAISGYKMISSGGWAFGDPNGVAPYIDASHTAADFFQRHINFVILIEAPLLAVFSRLVFRRDRTNVAEHLVLACYTSGMRSLFSTLIIVPGALLLQKAAINPVYLRLAGLAIWFAYYGFATVQFSRAHNLASGLKGVSAAVLAWLAVQIVLSAITMGVILYLAYS